MENGVNKGKTELRPIDKPIYGIWQALYMCFYSRSLYVDVGKRWKGMAFLYLLLSIALLSIPLSIKVMNQFQDKFERQIVNPLKQMPTLYVQNGEISINKPMPYLVKNEQGQVVLIVDTTGKVADFGPEYPYLTVLVKKDGIYFRLPSPNLKDANGPPQYTSKPIAQHLDNSVNAIFDASSFVAQPDIKRLHYTSQGLIYPIVIAAVFSFFIIMYPVLAMLGQVFSSVFFSFQIGYRQALRLLIVSGTPMMVLLFAFLIIGKQFALLGVILIVLMIFYYAFALHALRSEYRQVVRE